MGLMSFCLWDADARQTLRNSSAGGRRKPQETNLRIAQVANRTLRAIGGVLIEGTCFPV